MPRPYSLINNQLYQGAVKAFRGADTTYDMRNRFAMDYVESATKLRKVGTQRAKATANMESSVARQIRKDASLRGNDYKEVSKAEFQKAHNQRARNLRAAFGLTAG